MTGGPPDSLAPAHGRVFPCRNCGASLRFQPSMGALTCAHCGAVNEQPAVESVDVAFAQEELDYLYWLHRQAGNEPRIEPQVVTCPQCGAVTRFEDNVVASVCAFCATPLVATEALASRQIRPRAVVPFRLERPAAQSVFRQWIAGRWFAPNALKRTVNAFQGVRSVYLPCWTFDAATQSRYVGQRGVNRTVRDTRRDADGRTVVVTRIVIDWYPASGTVSVAFDDTLVPASHSLPAHLAEVLTDWDISDMVPYSDDYVAGFTVEAYQLALEPAFTAAQRKFKAVIDGAVRADIGGDHQQVHDIQTQYNQVTFKHILLPAWICSYQYGGKPWRVVVNGQTGHVRGDRPWSAWKITGAVIIAVIAGLLAWMLLR